MTSCGTESSVNTNGNESRPDDREPIQPQSMNMHFEALDPVQFESMQLFEQIQPADNLSNIQVKDSSNISEVNAFAPSNDTNLPIAPENVPIALQTEPIAPQTIPVAQPTTEALFNQANTTHSNAFSHFEQPYPNVNQFPDLIHRNQELTNLLQVEKVRNHELMVKVSQQHSTIEDISRELEQLRGNGNTIQELQQQVNAQIQTVNVLVGEKTDLTAKLQHKDQRIAEFESESVELRGRLNASRHRVAELEKDLNTLTQSHQKYDGSQQALCSELETLQEENKRLKRLHQEACDENTEIQHQFALKTKEIDELKKVIDAKCNELEMASVRLEQLTGGQLQQSNELQKNDQHDQRLLDSERQIIELQNMISELTNDRDRTQQQYQTYVHHLTNETTTLNQRIQELTKANDKLTKREESLVNHVQELEKQIQKQISTQRRLAALRDEEKPKSDEPNKDADSSQSQDELNALREKLSALEKEKSDLNVRNFLFFLISVFFMEILIFLDIFRIFCFFSEMHSFLWKLNFFCEQF